MECDGKGFIYVKMKGKISELGMDVEKRNIMLSRCLRKRLLGYKPGKWFIKRFTSQRTDKGFGITSSLM